MTYIRGVERRSPVSLLSKLVNGVLNCLVEAFFGSPKFVPEEA